MSILQLHLGSYTTSAAIQRHLLGSTDRPISTIRYQHLFSTTLAYTSLPPTTGPSQKHRPRASSTGNSHVLGARQRTLSIAKNRPDAAVLQPIPDNAREQSGTPMSLSRTPSPQRAGGWSSPGLEVGDGPARDHSRTPKPSYGLNGGHNVTWASAQARSAQINSGYAKTPSSGLGFLGRHMRKISASLPIFSHGGEDDRYAEKEKLGRGRWQVPGNGTFANMLNRFGRMIWRMRLRFVLLVAFLMALLIFSSSRKSGSKSYSHKVLIECQLSNTYIGVLPGWVVAANSWSSLQRIKEVE